MKLCEDGNASNDIHWKNKLENVLNINYLIWDSTQCNAWNGVNNASNTAKTPYFNQKCENLNS